jgi:hypothetical protein
LAKTFGVTPEELLPNRVETSAGNDPQPEFAMTSAGQSGYVWLTINQMVKLDVAVKIAALLANDDRN